jgi:hypothetical protein
MRSSIVCDESNDLPMSGRATFATTGSGWRRPRRGSANRGRCARSVARRFRRGPTRSGCVARRHVCPPCARSGHASMTPDRDPGQLPARGVSMFDPMSAREFHAADGTDNWRVIGDGATAFFATAERSRRTCIQRRATGSRSRRGTRSARKRQISRSSAPWSSFAAPCNAYHRRHDRRRDPERDRGRDEPLRGEPGDARATDSAAIATLVDGLVVEVAGPAGARLRTDMVAGVGGTGTARRPAGCCAPRRPAASRR